MQSAYGIHPQPTVEPAYVPILDLCREIRTSTTDLELQAVLNPEDREEVGMKIDALIAALIVGREHYMESVR